MGPQLDSCGRSVTVEIANDGTAAASMGPQLDSCGRSWRTTRGTAPPASFNGAAT